MSPVHFGKKVVGETAYAKAVASEKGGAAIFGVRVRGAIPESGPTNIAKRVTEHGPRVVADASFQDADGKETDGVSIEDLKRILGENTTTFDSLYEAELAREDGARPEALAIFYEVERGTKGQMRADIMDQIKALLKQKQGEGERSAILADAQTKVYEAMQKRNEENAKLVDADKVKKLAERRENLDKLEEAGEELAPASVEAQVKAAGGGSAEGSASVKGAHTKTESNAKDAKGKSHGKGK